MIDKQRKEPRFIAHFDGLYRFKNSHDWHDCYINDVSESGASLRINQSLVADDLIEICLDKDHREQIISAIVVNVMGQVVGVKFRTANIEDIIDSAVKRAFNKTRVKPPF